MARQPDTSPLQDELTYALAVPMHGSGHIGVDCGATHCRIAWEQGNRRVDFIGTGANFTSDPEGCIAAIRNAFGHVAKKSGIAPEALTEARAYLGVAGVQTQEQAQRLRTALPFQEAVVEEDRRAMVVGALGAGDGFVAGLGTGSFYSRKSGTVVTSIGGHGLILGDEASGAWLGREALRWTLHAQDGLVESSALTRATLDEFGGASGLIRFATGAQPAEFARLAKGLAQAAEQRDVVARALLHRGAGWIARALRALGWRKDDPLCLPGDLGAAYYDFLEEPLQSAIVPAQGTGLDGALALARGGA